MEILIIVCTLIFNIALSLGVGSSTLAVINFFVAIADGTINPDERRMMGVVYVVLRIALSLLLVTTLLLSFLNLYEFGVASYMPSSIATWILLFALYFNAILMTFQLIPSAFGPAIQAGTWYTFGIVATLSSLEIIFSLTQFIMFYLSFILFTIMIINCVMMYLEHTKKKLVPEN